MLNRTKLFSRAISIFALLLSLDAFGDSCAYSCTCDADMDLVSQCHNLAKDASCCELFSGEHSLVVDFCIQGKPESLVCDFDPETMEEIFVMRQNPYYSSTNENKR